jgi:hypothetical protein
VLWRMAIVLKADKVNLFVSSVLFVFWYHSPNFLNTPRTYRMHTEKSVWCDLVSNTALCLGFQFCQQDLWGTCWRAP